MTDFLIDTNHASWLMANSSHPIQWSRQSADADNRFGISMTVLGELYYAVFASQKRAQNMLYLQQFVDAVHLWEFDELAAQEYGRIQAEQKIKGRPIPPLDAQIAAVARVNNLTVFTADHHFHYIDNLSVANWLQK